MTDRSLPLELRSPYDGTARRAVLRLPASADGKALPLVLAPHPFGWTVEQDYAGGCEGLRATEHRGWHGVASELGIAVLQLEGHDQHEALCSLGGPGTAADTEAWIDLVSRTCSLDAARTYACGLSVGGQESLLMCGAHPDRFAACFVFNPVVDPAAWYEDLATRPPEGLRAERLEEHIAREVGGIPTAVPDAYRERNPLEQPLALTSLPLAIWWSRVDNVVPRQETHHGKRLYDVLKATDPAAPVTEYDHTALHRLGADPSEDARWGVHEWSDYGFAARWLLMHSR